MTAFHKTTWSKVIVGDTVLMPWASLDKIVEVGVVECEIKPGLDAAPLAFVEFKFDEFTYERTFDPDDVAYVQLRF